MVDHAHSAVVLCPAVSEALPTSMRHFAAVVAAAVAVLCPVSGSSVLSPVVHKAVVSDIYNSVALSRPTGAESADGLFVVSAFSGMPPNQAVGYAAGAAGAALPWSGWTPAGGNDTRLNADTDCVAPRRRNSTGLAGGARGGGGANEPVAFAGAAVYPNPFGGGPRRGDLFPRDARGRVVNAVGFPILHNFTCQYAAFAAGAEQPLWTYRLASCFTFLGSGSSLLEVSDDGSVVAMLVAINKTGSAQLEVQLHVLDAATGAAVGSYATPAGPKGAYLRSLSVSADGSVVAFVNQQHIYVFNTTAGALMTAPIPNPGVSPAVLCPLGHFLAFGGEEIEVLAWNGSAYAPHITVAGPPGFEVEAIDISVNGGWDSPDGCLLGAAWLSPQPFLSAAVSLTSLLNGTALWTWRSPANAALQASPTALASDGPYFAYSAWGDGGNSSQPSVALFHVSSPEPVATFASPGSMNDVDVVALPGSVVVAAAGKHVHANVRGTGGDLYTFEVAV